MYKPQPVSPSHDYRSRRLGFLIIGAQKSGTTTLFRWLQEHPAIFMPAEKEAPFFSHPARFARGEEYLFRRWFAAAPDDTLWGKATPHYMTEPEIPRRIASMFPDIKLIAMLRDPVERAFSHYSMMSLRGVEKRTFAQAVQEQLDPDASHAARQSGSPVDTYVAWGEYGRILRNYLAHFDRQQLLVIFTADLASRPEQVVQRVQQFLGVKPMKPANLDQRFHVGGNAPRIPNPLNRLKYWDGLRGAWERVPPRLARHVERGVYWFDQWNIKKGDAPMSVAASTAALLRSHYAEDFVTLRAVVTEPIPWDRSTSG